MTKLTTDKMREAGHEICIKIMTELHNFADTLDIPDRQRVFFMHDVLLTGLSSLIAASFIPTQINDAIDNLAKRLKEHTVSAS